MDRWDIDPLSEQGNQKRPYYIPLSPEVLAQKHINPKDIEQRLLKLSAKLAKRGTFSFLRKSRKDKPKKYMWNNKTIFPKLKDSSLEEEITEAYD